jgi:hypothetical protein
MRILALAGRQPVIDTPLGQSEHFYYPYERRLSLSKHLNQFGDLMLKLIPTSERKQHQLS